MKLKDRLSSPNGGYASAHTSQSGPKQFKSNEACRCYNRGHCKFGSKCSYEHKRSYCGKVGHTVLNCRKLIADKERTLSKKEKDGGNELHISNLTFYVNQMLFHD